MVLYQTTFFYYVTKNISIFCKMLIGKALQYNSEASVSGNIVVGTFLDKRSIELSHKANRIRE